MLITKLTGKVETNDEVLDQLKEQVEKADHDLKQERERFNIRLIESQKYFEETLKEQEENITKLKKTLGDKETNLAQAENDLREILNRHEQDIQKIMAKGEVNLHDSVIQMLEQKMKDTNDVLEGKIKVIEELHTVSLQKDRELEESKSIQKSFKDKLQSMSEQMMLSQANLVDMESHWQEQKKKYESKITEITEKHEHETTEKELQIQSLQYSSSQLESAYSQSTAQYSALQERYHHLVSQGGAGDASTMAKAEPASGDGNNKDLESIKQLLKVKEQEIEELICHKQKSESLGGLLQEKEDEISKLKKSAEEKSKDGDSSGSGAKSGDTKMLKMKAQLTAKVKTLEKEIAELRKVHIDPFICLDLYIILFSVLMERYHKLLVYIIQLHLFDFFKTINLITINQYWFQLRYKKWTYIYIYIKAN